MAFKKTSWNPEDHQIRLGNDAGETIKQEKCQEVRRVGVKGNEKGSSQEPRNGLEKQENRER